MKKLMNAVIGDPKTASPAKKYAAYALLGTAVAFVLALVILIVSSIVFAVADGKNPTATPSGDVGEELGGATVNKSAIIYDTSISSEDLDAMVGKIVKVADTRTKLDAGANDHYYAKNDSDGEDKLNEVAGKALDKMLIAFYSAKKDVLVVDTNKETTCNIPLVSETGEDGYTFKLIVFHNNADISIDENKATYQWIFDNAHNYGFIYTGNSFRYVGVAAATYMRNNAKNVKDYSAFVNFLKGNTKSNVPVTINKVSYQMYYLAADGDLKVPTNYVFNVIADGTDGYIVTVDMSQKINAVTTESDGGVG
jgi:hypothetical protein